MPSSWLERRETKAGDSRYRVRYLLGGREERPRYAGSFKTKTEALARKRWVDGELAAMRVPETSLVGREPERAPLLRDVTPAVVNIAVQGRIREENPLYQDPFFRQFFNIGHLIPLSPVP